MFPSPPVEVRGVENSWGRRASSWCAAPESAAPGNWCCPRDSGTRLQPSKSGSCSATPNARRPEECLFVPDQPACRPQRPVRRRRSAARWKSPPPMPRRSCRRRRVRPGRVPSGRGKPRRGIAARARRRRACWRWLRTVSASRPWRPPARGRAPRPARP